MGIGLSPTIAAATAEGERWLAELEAGSAGELPQAIQSVAVHLIRLCLLLERDLSMERANAAMLKASEQEAKFVWLTPPASLGAVTVAEVWKTEALEAHMATVRRWAQSAWEAWSPHHGTIKKWLPEGY